jgi:hypothetical protein
MQIVKNMASWDRLIRLGVSAAIVAMAALGVISGVLMYVLLVIALIFTVTSVTGFCPLYTLFGFKTKK